MTSLLIDTAHTPAWIGLSENDVVRAEQEITNPITDLLPDIDALLKRYHQPIATLDRIAVHVGPGSFSALRTGTVTATILAKTHDIDLVELVGEATTPADYIIEAMAATPVSAVTARYKKSPTGE